MTPAHRRLAALSAGAVLLLALSACTGEETPSATEPPAPAPATEVTSPPATATPEPTEDATAAPTPAPAEPTPAPEVTAGGEDAAAATGVDAAQAWVSALGDGDLDAAYAVLGEDSREEIGQREGLESLRSALAEGWGAFARADPRYLETPLDGTGAGAGVVTVVATVTQEGVTERRALTLPYRIDDAGHATVDPFAASEAQTSIDQPQPGATVDCEVAVNASVPAGAGAVSLSVDGDALPAPEVIPTDSDVDALDAALPAGLAGGEHVLTVAFLDGAGRIGGSAGLFTLQQGCS